MTVVSWLLLLNFMAHCRHLYPHMFCDEHCAQTTHYARERTGNVVMDMYALLEARTVHIRRETHCERSLTKLDTFARLVSEQIADAEI